MELTNLPVHEVAKHYRHAKRVGDTVYQALVSSAWQYVEAMLERQDCPCCYSPFCITCGYCHSCDDDDIRPLCIEELFV